MELKVFLIAFFLAGIIASLIIFLFWNKFLEKSVRVYKFLNYYYLRIQLLGPIFSIFANVIIEGRWENIRVIFQYYFKKKKF